MLITLSQKSAKPLYQQVVEQIKGQILKGELKGDEPLPSIRTLAKELTTSVITVKRAYAELEKEGFIYTRQGLGSFVSELNNDEINVVKLKEVEDMLEDGVKRAIQVGLNLEEVIKMVEKIYQERRENK